MDAVLRILNVYPEEKKVTVALFALAFALGLGRVFTITPGFSLFFDAWDESALPYVYMLMSVGTIAASAGYLRLGSVLPPRVQITTNLLVVAGITLGLWVLIFANPTARGPVMGLAVWALVLIILSNLAFWGTATKVVDIRQGKRLFPVVATGEVIGTTVGGLTAEPIVGALGTPQLLLFSVAGFGLAAFVFAGIGRGYRDRFAVTGANAVPKKERKPIPWSSPYLRFMIASFFLSGALFVFVDNAFNTVAKDRYTDAGVFAEGNFAVFYGRYQAVTALINFGFRSFVTGRLIERFGMLAGLIGLPVALLTGSILMGAALVFGMTWLVFWLMTATKVSDKIFRGVQASSFATLYQPLMDKGPAVQATMEGMVDAAAVGTAAAVLLGLNQLGIDVGGYAFIIGGLGVAWIITAVLLKRQYVQTLGGVLTRQRLSAEVLDVTDDIVPLVKDELDSDHAENVIYALDLLERSGVPFFKHAVRHILNHALPEVRIEALKRVEKHRVRIALDRVSRLAEGDPDAHVRGWAMRTQCIVDEDAIDRGVAALEHDDHTMRRGAMVGLLRSGSMEGIVYAGSELLKFFQSNNPRDREFAASVLRDTADASFYRPARTLLKDADPGVRRAAIEAAGAMAHSDLWGPVVRALGDRETRTTAARVLARGREGAVPALIKGFQYFEYDRAIRIELLRLLGRIGTASAVAHLVTVVDAKADEERYAALKALASCGYEPVRTERAQFRDRLLQELQDMADAYAAVADLSAHDDLELLREALEFEIEAFRHRLFLILHFMYPGSDALTAWNNYAHGDRDRRAYALELVDNFIDADLREELFPALEDITVADRLEKWDDALTINRHSPREWLQSVLDAPEGAYTRWTLHCARFVGPAVGIHVSDMRDATIVDRTLRLRNVDLFAEMTPPELAEVVPRLQELSIGEGELIFAEGDAGDSLYILDSGEVRIDEHGLTLATLPAGRVFGEFTVLQSAQRTASVRTTQASHLYRFDQRELYELMGEQVAIARGLIRIILKRLQENRKSRESGPARTSRVSISLKPLEEDLD